jgi:hypothetical protein
MSMVFVVGPVPLVPNAAKVTITPSRLTVPAGQTLSVVVTFEPPTGVNPSNFPVYSGYIQATGSDNSTLQSTYLGVAAKMRDMKLLDNTDAYLGTKLPYLADANGDPVPEGGSVTYNMSDPSIPQVIARLVGGTRLFLVDLIDDGAGKTARTLGSLLKSEYVKHDDGSLRGDWGGLTLGQNLDRFANGTAIPNGTFRILVRALKITGDPKQERDYERWLSPKFVVKRA